MKQVFEILKKSDGCEVLSTGKCLTLYNRKDKDLINIPVSNICYNVKTEKGSKLHLLNGEVIKVNKILDFEFVSGKIVSMI